MSKAKSKPTKTSARSASSISMRIPGILQRHPHAIYLSILAVLLIIFFHEAFFSGKVFNVPDTISSIQYEQGYLEKAKQDGVNAFWNPYVFSGMPTWGSSSPGHGMYLHTFLDPLKPMLLLQVYGWVQTVINILPLPTTFWDIFNFFLLGLFTYMFGVRRKFEPFTAFLVAVSVVFSLYSLNWIMGGHNTKITVFAWLPAILLLIDMLFEKKSVLTIALLITAMHFTFNSGHVQMIFYSLMVSGFYTLYKMYEGEKVTNGLIVIGITLGSAAFAFLMLSGPYFATWEYKDFSIRGAGSGGSGHGPAGGGLDYDYATNWSFSPMEMITFFVPSFVGFGTPTYWGTMIFTESPIYLGVVISFLALLGIVLRPKDKFVHFWIFLGLIALLISFGRNFGVLYNILFNNLPLFNNFRIPSMILFLEALCMGMLAGVGVSDLISRAKNRGKSSESGGTIKAIWAPVCFAATLFLILIASSSMMKTTIRENLQKNQPQSWNLVEQVERAAQAGQMSQVPEQYRKATVDGIFGMAKDDALVALVFMTITAFLLWAFIKSKIGYMVLQVGLVLVVIVDWWIVDYKPMNMVPKQEQLQTLEKSDVVDFLEKDKNLYRILPVSGHGGDNYFVAFGIRSVAGYHPAKMKYYDDIRNSIFNQFQFSTAEQIDKTNWALLSMLNTKYVLVPSGTAVKDPWLKLVFNGQNEDVYQNEYNLPHAFFVGHHEVIEDDAAMFKKIGTLPGYAPDRVAYLSAPLGEDVPVTPDSLIAQSMVSVTNFGINTLELAVDTKTEALLKVSEVYYPSGWVATIDRNPTEILRCDYALRAIIVPAGKHRVVMNFEPKSYKAGLIVTTITNYLLGIILFVYLVLWVRKRFGMKKQVSVSESA